MKHLKPRFGHPIYYTKSTSCIVSIVMVCFAIVFTCLSSVSKILVCCSLCFQTHGHVFGPCVLKFIVMPWALEDPCVFKFIIML
jgi:hypothetical protein